MLHVSPSRLRLVWEDEPDQNWKAAMSLDLDQMNQTTDVKATSESRDHSHKVEKLKYQNLNLTQSWPKINLSLCYSPVSYTNTVQLHYSRVHKITLRHMDRKVWWDERTHWFYFQMKDLVVKWEPHPRQVHVLFFHKDDKSRESRQTNCVMGTELPCTRNSGKRKLSF